MSPSPLSPFPTRPRRLRHVLATLLLATIALLVPALPASAAEADTIYSLLNDARVANGQAALARNSALDQVAEAWAAQLSAAGVLSHNPNYPTQIPAGWSEAGENVAQGQQTANEMHGAWMNSAGHRANILGNFTDVGVAWLTDGNGRTWGVQVFANYPVAAADVSVASVTVAPTEGRRTPRFTRDR
jgi:uncharacterized protein YkwD